MKKAVKVQVRSSNPAELDDNLLSLGMALKEAIETAGGRCLPLWLDRTLTVWFEGTSPSRAEALLSPFIASAQKHGDTLSITQMDEVELPWNEFPQGFLVPGSILRERMTKKLFFSLPERTRVVSTFFPNGVYDTFDEYLGEIESRPEAWERARSAGVAHRDFIAIAG